MYLFVWNADLCKNLYTPISSHVHRGLPTSLKTSHHHDVIHIMWQHPLVMWPHPVVTWPHSCIGWAHDDVISILYNVTVCVCWWCNYEVIWGHSEIIWCNGDVTWCGWRHDDVMWSNPSADLCVREDIGMIRFLQRSAMQTNNESLEVS